MFSLKDHPFPVETFFENSLVLTYAAPKEELVSLIPECLTLDTYKDKWAFLAAAMVKTRGLRPKGLPEVIGNDFILIGYRVFVRFKTAAGKNLRGLYIIGSQTNRKKMEFWGNIFTHYNYTTTDIEFTRQNNIVTVHSDASGLDVQVQSGSRSVNLPEGSPFESWTDAGKFAGPLPFTFTYNKAKKEVLIIEGVRSNWKPEPVEVISEKINFIDSKNINGLKLANAFMIENIPYHWKKGRKEIWNG
ncbi:MAG TPA: DUF2071 domain-containing protein [Ignavibacteria bacterium]|nr:hypothetical protein [Bacteroidota bacterium]HRE09573.1 DUF2071 domain-containing protein [Ignavibacteria bacterium]HRF64408.1 DUF2071 domain-containing protein [Ignavibacteria bacterium]HRJ04143.1 DUF2071 domain-containing protein [Ignavibacteria bacterium]HRJ86118.1 DUF2071 domain-containing protein [Ignavibacteria bacterium]